jgi:hypothetical protein
MSTEQNEALRLADDLIDLWDSGFFEREDVEKAAAELRRLHNEVADLKQAFEIAARGMRRQIAELQSALAEQPAQQQEPVACRLCASGKGSWSWQCHSCGEFDDTRTPSPQPAQKPNTYASTQATNCAVCGKHKHTPLRIDAMGGYVCLTCIDQKLGSLLGEFGYPKPEQPAQPEHHDPIGDAQDKLIAEQAAMLKRFEKH